MILLAVGCVAATLIVAVALLLYQAAVQRAKIEETAEAMARSVALGIDRELGAAEALLTGLAVSNNLTTGDLASFHEQITRLPKPPGSWILLLDPDGRMLVNEKRPYGTPLPDLPEDRKKVVAAIAEDRRMQVTNLIRAQVTDDNGAAVGVPVIREGKVAYVLALSLVGPALTGRFKPDSVPIGWSAAVLDRVGAVVIRHPAEAPEFDTAAARALIGEIEQQREHAFETTAATGRSIFVAHSPSALSGWRTVVAVPSAILAAPMHRAMLLVSGGGGVLALLAIGAAVIAGSRIERPWRASVAASEERFYVMAETVPAILFAAAPDGQCQYVNQRFYELTGMRSGSALGSGWISALHPDDQDRARGLLRQTVSEGDFALSEIRFRTKDGDYHWFLSRARPVRDSRGKIVNWFGSATDIDGLKQSQALNQRINERLNAVLASIDECYYTVDHDWRITHVNPRAATYFRQEPTGLVGRTLWEVSPHVSGTELERQIRAALEERKPLHLERMSQEYPGRWFQISCYPWAEGLAIFFRDISRRKVAEMAVHSAHELLQRTMDALSTQIAILDERGNIVGVNAAWRRFVDENGFRTAPAHGSGSDLLAIAATAIPDPARRKQVENGVRAVLHGERNEFHTEYAVHAPSAPTWFQIRVTPFGNNGARRVVIAQEDISDIKAAEEGLRQLAGRLLRLQDEERRRTAQELHDTTAQNLVAALLDLERLQQEVAPLGKPSEAVFNEAHTLVEQSLREIRTLSYLLHPPLLDELGLASALGWYVRGFEDRSGIRVALKAQESMERLPTAVEQALFRVVQEALTNVHRHSASASAEIRLAQSGSEVVLEVVDEGRGITKQASSGIEGIAALGVGVSGMRARLQQLGGDLSIRSTEQGTTVRARVSLDRLPSVVAAS